VTVLTRAYVFCKKCLQMSLRARGEWALSEMDEATYNTDIQLGESPGDGKRQDLVYYLAVQPCQP
jgi:hypothetical protein